MEKAKAPSDYIDEGHENLSPRLLVLHNRSLYAEGIADLLRRHCDLDVEQCTVTMHTARDRVKEASPDLVILDSQDARLKTHALLLHLLRDHPNLHVLCLTMGDACPLECPARVKHINTKDELMAAIRACAGCDLSSGLNDEDNKHG